LSNFEIHQIKFYIFGLAFFSYLFYYHVEIKSIILLCHFPQGIRGLTALDIETKLD